MEAIEIIVLIFAVALVAFSIVFNIIRRFKGKSSCGCACKGCPSAKTCSKNKSKG